MPGESQNLFIQRSNKESFRFKEMIQTYNENSQNILKLQAIQKQKRKTLINQLYNTLRAYELKISNLEQEKNQFSRMNKEIILSKTSLLKVIQQKNQRIRQLEDDSYKIKQQKDAQIVKLKQINDVLMIQLQNHKNDVQFMSNLNLDKQQEISRIRESFQIQPGQQLNNSVLSSHLETKKRQLNCKIGQLNGKIVQNKTLKSMIQGLQELNAMQKQNHNSQIKNYSKQLEELTKTFDQSQKQKQSYRRDLGSAQQLFNQLSAKKTRQIIDLTQKYQKAKKKIRQYENQRRNLSHQNNK